MLNMRTADVLEEKKDINLDGCLKSFIDYDEESNSYWLISKTINTEHRKQFILIYSKYGKILDAFYYGEYSIQDEYYLEPDFTTYPTSGAEISISPSGDVYFMVGNETEYKFYKVERQW